jgi:hypothetical protein
MIQLSKTAELAVEPAAYAPRPRELCASGDRLSRTANRFRTALGTHCADCSVPSAASVPLVLHAELTHLSGIDDGRFNQYEVR